MKEVINKSWRFKHRASCEYGAGVDDFIRFAVFHSEDKSNISCPCNDCKNFKVLDLVTVKDHLIERGIDMTYDPFIDHGEEAQTSAMDEEFEDVDVYDTDTFDMLRTTYTSNTKEFPGDAKQESKFQNLIKDVEKPLYGGCKNYNKLEATVALYELKATSGWSDRSFDKLLEILKDMLPEDNIIPSSHYSARSLLRKFDLDFKQIHACINDCILYRNEHKDKVSCHKCQASRWERDPYTKKIRENVPAKVLRYFPIIPRFKRMFKSVDTAENLTWHSVNKSSDGKMRHPVDTPAWKHIDINWPTFAENPRNLRLGLSADGVNPYGKTNSNYSCWPILLFTYNLPPWLCMLKKFTILSLIIPGPKQPGNNIDVYLQPLIDDLKLLWTEGVEAYDAYTKTTFSLKAVLMWTINDFPAYGNLAGCVTKGKKACPKCGVNTFAQSLKYSRKCCYMGSRRFLPSNHPLRFKKSWFNGKQEFGKKPIPLKGTQIWDEVKHIENDWGKSTTQKKRKREEDVQIWKKRSIFFELPYWKHLLLVHNLDVMHIEKNICESLLGTLLNMKNKTKDGLKSRKDLKVLGIRHDLHPISINNRILLPPAPYVLSKEEKRIFCERLKSLKLPDGYCSNIPKRVSLSDYTIHDLKSHDYHVLMQQLLPVALRGLLPKGARHTIFRLCLFYHELCQRTIDREKMESLEDEVVHTMCLLERYFPPSFFDIMVHLTIHLVREACIGGPVQYRYMYPPERYMKGLKRSVKNPARPEGCMAECYLAEECVKFCAEHMKREESVNEKESRNEDFTDGSSILEGRPLLKGEPLTLPEETLEVAHRCILFNFEEVQPYIEKHQLELIRQEPRLKKNEGALRSKHTKTFSHWFQCEIENEKKNKPVSDVLDWLSSGPSPVARSYKGYLINGYRFHTKDGEKGTQNSGVSLSANTLCRSSAKDTRQIEQNVIYYGVIRQILVLDYYTFQYPVFNCDWANVASGIKVDDGFTLVNLHQNLYHRQDPFILASQAEPVFFSRESSDSDWYVVMRAPPRGLIDVDGTNNDLVDLPIAPPMTSTGMVDDLLSDEESEAYARPDCEGTWIKKKKKNK